MLELIYQDQNIVVCIKPAGVLSQDAGEGSMPQLLREQLKKEYVAVVHRLDKEVGGLMVYALSQKAAAGLSRAIQKHDFGKTYLAVLQGVPQEQKAVLEDLLFHDKNRNKTYVVDRVRKNVKDASLDYVLMQEVDGRSLVKVRLHTGRTHQIRVQFASRKLPLVGDRKYGGKAPDSRLGLWSYSLRFPHPVTGKVMEFVQLPPEEMPWSSFQMTGNVDIIKG